MIKTPIDIEKLVTWALRDQGLGWSIGAGDSLSGVAELGTRIDRSSMAPPSPALQTDDDALVVQRAIEMLPADAAWLVIRYGRLGDRPEWGEDGYGRPRQMVGGNGKPQWLYRDERNKRGKIGPKLDWSGYDAHVRQIDFERAEWRAWRESLAALGGRIAADLRSHDLTGMLPPAEPWAGLADDGPVRVPSAFNFENRRLAASAPVFTAPRDTDPANSRFAAADGDGPKRS